MLVPTLATRTQRSNRLGVALDLPEWQSAKPPPRSV
jgi:hypothetical protein